MFFMKVNSMSEDHRGSEGKRMKLVDSVGSIVLSWF